jgi:HK97 family phage major capsid protein
MTIAEQLAALRATREAKQKRLSEVGQKAIDESRSMDSGEGEEFDTLEAEIKTLDADIARYSRLEAMQAASAKAVDGSANANQVASTTKGINTVQARNTEKLEPGIEFARFAMCVLGSKGNEEKAFRLAEKHYPQNERVVRTLKAISDGANLGNIMKATVEAGTTLDATWAAPLVDYQNFAGDFVEYLRPRTIIGQFGQGNIPPLNRIPFNVRIASQTTGGAAQWVGEGAPKPLTSFDFTATELRWAKVAAISVLTNELIRFSSPSAERLVRLRLSSVSISTLSIRPRPPLRTYLLHLSPMVQRL